MADRAGLAVEFTEDFSESVPRGAVIETDPSAGSKILKGGRMTATVSRGPERFAMPTVVGLSREAAETAVQQANLSLDDVSEKYSDTVRDGIVLSASEKPGAPLKRSTGSTSWSPRAPRPSRSRTTSAGSSSERRRDCARPASPSSRSGSTPTRWPRAWCWRRIRSPDRASGATP